MDNEWSDLEKGFDVPFGLLPGLPRGQVLCGKTERSAIEYMQARGWHFVSTFQDYRLLFRHPSGYSIRLILEMDEKDGDMVVMGVDNYSTRSSS
jgi:hypothetical protein